MEINDIQSDLKDLKEKVDNAKNNLATLKGRKQEILKQLKKEFGLNSLKEANEKMKALNKEYEKLEKQITDDYNGLKEKYDW